ncbi:P-loop containing nucleoside triphosphate hydrolase protein [Guyanagaster necrorhizus]|uniref:P-loop containing nucleoside triphosphate hydrolase protein n=1 Tax=Guyanagaster necrorhizus TaxID=856835 RepID=A0A9P7VI97_9AGAR|nr:P-loop containing nucleoside triphosphate hydrolase protein [Guyanagaster necrorhizus MCA 3950]KAG7440444.1 P-loop containing nucleoside triphosphate hydrolase protein [Guyanagaster necrorhizus MCA 3950]
MATYLQQILSGLAPLINSTVAEVTNTTSALPQATISPLSIPNDLSSLISLLFSFSALRDWLKLIVLGGFFETCRRVIFAQYAKFVDAFYMKATFEEDDPSYEWMMVWLSRQPSWAKARDIQVSTNTYGANSNTVMLEGEEDSSEYKTSRKLAYLPSVSMTYSLWYKRRYMTITRTLQDTTGSYYATKHNVLQISLLTRSHSLLIGLLQEARSDFMAAQEHKICVWVSDVNNGWKHVGCRAKRSMNSIILESGVKDLLLEDARDFLGSKDWYAERGIPFRRGYLLYGVPGSGKTSLIHSIAGELGLDIYIISLSRVGLDDSSLDALINELPERCVALMEDIDAAFTRTLNRDDDDASDSESSASSGANKTPKTGSPPPPPGSRVSLSGLLNALDGIGAQEGRILFATTNKHTSLDPALCRPGRMDLHIEFRLSSKYQAREMFKRFYIPSSQCSEADDDDEAADSGYGSAALSEATDSTPPSPADSKSSESPVSESSSAPPAFFGSRHVGRAPKLSKGRVDELATLFSDIIPDQQFSMAALQGYLMMHKTRPFAAVAGAQDWVEKELKDRSRREKQKREKEEKEKEKKAKEKKEAREKDEVKDTPKAQHNPSESDKAIQVTQMQVSS